MDENYESIACSWSKPEEVDWLSVTSQLADYLSKVIAHFSETIPAAQVYGVVIENGQNWDVSVYLNTEEGFKNGPSIFRPNSRGYENRTDDQIREDLGRWYYHAWEFQNYEFSCPKGTNDLNNLHYEVFGELHSSECEQSQVNPDADLSERHLLACADAIAIFEASPAFAALFKTNDFRVRLYDGNRYEWDTDAIMTKARERS
jgi:hypothetical protein